MSSDSLNLQPAIFFDRDGVLIKHVHHLHCPKDLELLLGVAHSLAKINSKGILAIVITNQSVVARGLCSEDELQVIHRSLHVMLAQYGARIDGIYYCPHYPPGLLRGGDVRYQVDCTCRKPKIGLFEQAYMDFNIDSRYSVFIGDSTSDIEAARRAGITSVLVETGYGGNDGRFDVQADYTAKNLVDAVNWLINKYMKQAEC